jgi:hypothetical protein
LSSRLRHEPACGKSLTAALAVAACDTKAKVDAALDKANKSLDEIPKLAKTLTMAVDALKMNATQAALLAEAVDFYLEAQAHRDGDVITARVAARLAAARAHAVKEAKGEIARDARARERARIAASAEPCRYCGRRPRGRR